MSSKPVTQPSEFTERIARELAIEDAEASGWSELSSAVERVGEIPDLTLAAAFKQQPGPAAATE